MEVILKSVSKYFRFDENGKEVGQVFSSIKTGLGSYSCFREELIKYVTNGKISKLNEIYCDTELCLCWYKDKTMEVVLQTNADEEVLNDILYIAKLNKMKKEFSKLYDIYPLIAHPVGEGEMRTNQLKKVLPILKEFRKSITDIKKYKWIDEFIKGIEIIIKKDGKLLFN